MFDELTGKVLFPDTSSVAPSIAASRSTYGTTRQGRLGEGDLADSMAQLYVAQPLRSISTVESMVDLTHDTNRPEEHFLWRLVSDFLRDAEKAPQYHPEGIGLEAIHPSRHWFISQHARIQELLMKNTLLRRCTTILRWLEEKYRMMVPPMTQRPQQSDSEHDAVLLRNIILHHLRGGQLSLALQTAESAKDPLYCCILAASEMQTEREAWFQNTELVPLFGEYSQGEVPAGEHQCANNDHRLTNIGYLYEDSLHGLTANTPMIKKLDALIAATLCGNFEVLQAGFSDDYAQPQWQHQLWALLRSALVSAFSKLLVLSGAHVPSMRYLQYLDSQRRGGGGQGDAPWDKSFGDDLMKEIVALLQPIISSANHPDGGATISAEEQLQIRVILEFLDLSTNSVGEHSGTFLLGGLGSIQQMDSLRGVRRVYGTPARLVTHLLLCLDLACSERLLRLPLQGTTLVDALCAFVASLHREDWMPIVHAICCMVLRLESPKYRATVFGTFIFAQRLGTLERGATKWSTEEQESSLISLVQSRDKDSAVHDGIVQFLHTKAQDATHSQHLLKNNPECETLMWEAMRADSPNAAVVILQRALQAALLMWQRDDVDAVATLVDLARRLLLPKAATAPQLLSSSDADQINFWDVVLKVRAAYGHHTQVLATLKAAGEGPAAYRLKEVPLRTELMKHVYQLLQYARGIAAAQPGHAGTIAACCAWAIRSAADAATLVLAMSPIQEDHATTLLQELFAMVDVFNRGTALMEPTVLARSDAQSLFSAIRTARGAFGMRRFQVRAEAALRSQ